MSDDLVKRLRDSYAADAEIRKAHMDGLKIQFEKWRTLQATRRTEMGLT